MYGHMCHSKQGEFWGRLSGVCSLLLHNVAHGVQTQDVRPGSKHLCLSPKSNFLFCVFACLFWKTEAGRSPDWPGIGCGAQTSLIRYFWLGLPSAAVIGCTMTQGYQSALQCQPWTSETVEQSFQNSEGPRQKKDILERYLQIFLICSLYQEMTEIHPTLKFF